MYAAYMGHDTILDLLFEAGADPNIKTIHGITALMLAASCGYESIAYTLLQVSLSVIINILYMVI